ncbi:hypothetical protein [Erwinia sp. HR93]|uniref:hypothetical protein n=1 Tax=Erwinia sp. HR93 TaxID=3094840 RepID=UPI002ADEDE93|nr:hypothetical protein [Erwinia sp. HR93]MEA1062263.1 hypothetical protein [Erwinia sp. HR93]MEA1063930.1 hypothetical protein [Erwinia sp. HR93]
MAEEKIEYKSSTELALELYPVIKSMIDGDPRVRSGVMVIALYQLMQLVDGPFTAGQVISSSQVHR